MVCKGNYSDQKLPKLAKIKTQRLKSSDKPETHCCGSQMGPLQTRFSKIYLCTELISKNQKRQKLCKITYFGEDEVRVGFDFHGVSCGLSYANIEYSVGF